MFLILGRLVLLLAIVLYFKHLIGREERFRRLSQTRLCARICSRK